MTLLPAMVALAGRRGLCQAQTRTHETLLAAIRHAGSCCIRCGIWWPASSCWPSWPDASARSSSTTTTARTCRADVDSNVGYAVMAQHFPVNSSIQQFILVQSPRDLRSPKALADLEQMARRVSQVPGIAAVRGITRPTGETLEQAKATYQAGASRRQALRGVDRDLQPRRRSRSTHGRCAPARRHPRRRPQRCAGSDDVRQRTDQRPWSTCRVKYGANTTLADMDQSAQLVDEHARTR